MTDILWHEPAKPHFRRHGSFGDWPVVNDPTDGLWAFLELTVRASTGDSEADFTHRLRVIEYLCSDHPETCQRCGRFLDGPDDFPFNDRGGREVCKPCYEFEGSEDMLALTQTDRSPQVISALTEARRWLEHFALRDEYTGFLVVSPDVRAAISRIDAIIPPARADLPTFITDGIGAVLKNIDEWDAAQPHHDEAVTRIYNMLQAILSRPAGPQP